MPGYWGLYGKHCLFTGAETWFGLFLLFLRLFTNIINIVKTVLGIELNPSAFVSDVRMISFREINFLKNCVSGILAVVVSIP